MQQIICSCVQDPAAAKTWSVVFLRQKASAGSFGSNEAVGWLAV